MDLIIIVFLSLGGIVLKPGKCRRIKVAGNYRNLRQLRCFRFRQGRGAANSAAFSFHPHKGRKCLFVAVFFHQPPPIVLNYLKELWPVSYHSK